MRKLFLHLLLPVFLLLAQQGAAWHEIGHWAQGRLHGGTTHSLARDEGPGDQADTLCELCLAFAGIATASRSESLALPLLEAGHVLHQRTAVAERTADSPVARSRGPPAPL